MTIIIGVSGGVASGKNFVCDSFLKFGARIFDADAEVSKLFTDNLNFQNKIKQYFPNSIVDGNIDKDLISLEIFNDKDKLSLLESIIHPIINDKMDIFISDCNINNINIALLNIPLLFEKGSYKKCDIAILIISDINLRENRFIKREKKKNPKISDIRLLERFNNIILNQQKDSEKSKLADEIIYNNSDQENIDRQIKSILKKYENNNC